MPRLIDAERLLALVCGRKCGCYPDECGCDDYHECEIGAYIYEAPTVDAVPVVHGRWIPFNSTAAGDIQYCSVCEVGNPDRTDYCPHCGAKMDGRTAI